MDGNATDPSRSPSNTSFSRKAKLSYTRTSVACQNCRKRKIRCARTKGDPNGRCANCIKLKKECVYSSVDHSPSDDGDACVARSKLDSMEDPAAPNSPARLIPQMNTHVHMSTSSYETSVPLALPPAHMQHAINGHPPVVGSDGFPLPHQAAWVHGAQHFPVYQAPHPQHAQWGQGRPFANQHEYDHAQSAARFDQAIVNDGNAQNYWLLQQRLGQPGAHRDHDASYLAPEHGQHARQLHHDGRNYHDMHQDGRQHHFPQHQHPHSGMYGSMHSQQHVVALPSQGPPLPQYYIPHPELDTGESTPTWDGAQDGSPTAESPRHDSMALKWQQSGPHYGDHPRQQASTAYNPRGHRNS